MQPFLSKRFIRSWRPIRLITPVLACALLFALWVSVSLLGPSPARAQVGQFSCAQVTEIPQSECEGLVSLYTSTNGTGWLTDTGWLQNNQPCATPWYRIHCNPAGTNVDQITLSNNNLTGVLPAKLANFSQLSVLHIDHNPGLGGSIPPELGTLITLTSLLLDHNKLTGPIPQELTKLKKLWRLNLGDNELTGKLPDSIGELHELLTDVYFSDNYLTGTIPNSICQLRKARYLYLSANAFTGTVPSCLSQIGADVRITPTSDFVINLNENLLSVTDTQVISLLRRYDAAFFSTQTVPPTDLQVRTTGPTSAVLTWNPITYSTGLGYYAIEATTSTQPAVMRTTTNKQESTVMVNNLCPGQQYTFTARTYSLPQGSQRNRLISSPSPDVAATIAPRAIDLLLLPILSFDSNLDEHYDEYIAGIAAATAHDTSVMALVLADRSDPTDPETRILKIACGRIEQLNGLPSLDLPATVLDANLHEYDMTNPRQLAAFIKWARTTLGGEISVGDPRSIKTFVSYVAHGLPIAPATDISRYLTENATTLRPAVLESGLRGLPPAPTKIPATPDQLTDQTSVTLISPYSLTLALALATDNGANPITVLDIVHCFGGTLEELYELSNPSGQPVAEMVVTSPNYTYAGAPILTEALLGIRPSQSARQMAEATVQAYTQALAQADGIDNNGNTIEHPRIITAVDLSKVAMIKDKVDELASGVMADFAADQSMGLTKTKALLLEAHSSAIHYDTVPTAYGIDDDPTSKCPHDYRLTAHDALSDITSFTQHLQENPTASPAIKAAANAIISAVEAAVIARTAAGGVPWFANNPLLEAWDFTGAGGIALYTDFHGLTLGENIYLGWQAHWYTKTVSADNPHPYQFVQGELTWANVIQSYWADQLGTAGVKTLACVTMLPQVKERHLYLSVIWR